MEADEAAVFLQAHDAMNLCLGHGTDFVVADAALGASTAIPRLIRQEWLP